MLVTSARTYSAFELVHKDGLKRRLHLLIRRKRGQRHTSIYYTLADKCRVNVKYSRSCPRLKHNIAGTLIEGGGNKCW